MSLLTEGGSGALGGSDSFNFFIITVALLVTLGIVALILTRNWTTLIIVGIMIAMAASAFIPVIIGASGFGWLILPLIVIPLVLITLYILRDQMPARRKIAIGGVILGVYLSYLLMSTFGIPGTPKKRGGGGSGTDLGLPSRQFFNPLNQNANLSIILILVLSIVVLLVWVKTHQWLEKRDRDPQVEEEIEEDISSTVDTAIKELHTGKDVRSTIMRCYKKMCNILEESGVSNDKSMTPREFRTRADEKLGASASRIDDLTDLFEEARYSSHSLSEDDREGALDNLKALREELGD